MHEVLGAADVRAMLAAVAQHVIANVDLLTRLDQAIGDGDHGIGMRRGFAAVLEQVGADKSDTAETVLKAAGTAIMSKTGGAAGAVFGTFFRAGAAALAGRDLDARGFAGFLQRGMEGVQERGGARPGQKTMLDALAPAVTAAASAAGLSDAMRAAAAAAAEGAEATKGMVAATGKARTLGERSLGHRDPGAVTLSLILAAMRDYVLGT